MNIKVSSLVLENYFNLLKHLDNISKKALISKLTQSMENNEPKPSNIKHLFGAWEDKRSSDEIIQDIRSSRVSSKDIESF